MTLTHQSVSVVFFADVPSHHCASVTLMTIADVRGLAVRLDGRVPLQVRVGLAKEGAVWFYESANGWSPVSTIKEVSFPFSPW